MGLSNNKSNTTFVSIVEDPDTGDVRFGIKKKNQDGKYKVSEVYQSISGKLVKVEKSSYKYKGDDKPTLELTFLDENESRLYKVSVNYNYGLLGLVNFLSTVDSFEGKELSVSVGKEDLSDKFYNFKYVQLGDDYLKSSKKWDEMKIKSDDDRDDWIDKFVKKIKKALPESFEAPQPTENADKYQEPDAPEESGDDKVDKKKASLSSSLDDDDDDLPF